MAADPLGSGADDCRKVTRCERVRGPPAISHPHWSGLRSSVAGRTPRPQIVGRLSCRCGSTRLLATGNLDRSAWGRVAGCGDAVATLGRGCREVRRDALRVAGCAMLFEQSVGVGQQSQAFPLVAAKVGEVG
jgi:hypothetical protein